MKQLVISLFTAVIVISFVGIFYYFIPGYSHAFVFNNTTSAQPTLGFFCIIVFMFAVVTAVQISEKKDTKR
jgi:hypothetical protein